MYTISRTNTKEMAADKERLHNPEVGDVRPRNRCCNGYCCAKIFAVVYGFFYFVIGLVILAFGVFILYAKQGYESLDISLTIPAILCLVIGAIMVATAMCGILGAGREKPVLLKIFLAFVVISFLVLVVVGIVAFIEREKVPMILQKHLQMGLNLYGQKVSFTKAIDQVQRRFECCGLDSFEDWNANRLMNCSNHTSLLHCSLPSSCCSEQMEMGNPLCGNQARSLYSKGVLKEKGFHLEGCTWKFIHYINDHLDAVGIAGLACAIIQILGMFILYIFITMVEDRVHLYKYQPWRKAAGHF